MTTPTAGARRRLGVALVLLALVVGVVGLLVDRPDEGTSVGSAPPAARMDPVVVVHGLLPTFDVSRQCTPDERRAALAPIHDLADWLRREGGADEVVVADLLPCPEVPGGPTEGWRLRAQADRLRRVVDEIRAGNGGAPVHLVAHSRGGLVARELVRIALAEKRSPGVASLITLGTGHQGSPAGPVGCIGLEGRPPLAPAACSVLLEAGHHDDFAWALDPRRPVSDPSLPLLSPQDWLRLACFAPPVLGSDACRTSPEMRALAAGDDTPGDTFYATFWSTPADEPAAALAAGVLPTQVLDGTACHAVLRDERVTHESEPAEPTMRDWVRRALRHECPGDVRTYPDLSPPGGRGFHER